MERSQEDRVVDLEVRYTHLERQVEDLNEVIVRQGKLIDDLTKRLAALSARFGQLGEDPAHERPPHY